MQDRFKFRCWDKVQQQMHYDDFIITSVGKIHKPFPSSLEMGTIQGNDDELAYRYLQFDQAENNDNSVILMQCTGLKDKNGKLIYEEDIVKRTKFKNGNISIGKVIYCEDEARYKILISDNDKYSYKDYTKIVNLYDVAYHLEIIGNICH